MDRKGVPLQQRHKWSRRLLTYQWLHVDSRIPTNSPLRPNVKYVDKTHRLNDAIMLYNHFCFLQVVENPQTAQMKASVDHKRNSLGLKVAMWVKRAVIALTGVRLAFDSGRLCSRSCQIHSSLLTFISNA